MPATPPPTDPAAQLRWLVDREALRDLVAAFALAIDDKDKAGYAANFTDDGVLELPFGRIEGRDAIATMQGPPVHWATVHLFGQILVDVDGDLATARAYTDTRHVFDLEDRTRNAGAGGWYRFALRRTAEGWRIAHVVLERVWESERPMLPGVPPPGGAQPGARPTAHPAPTDGVPA